MTIEEIFQEGRDISEIISGLQYKELDIPRWSELEKEYNPKLHPVMTDRNYRDMPNDDGTVDRVSRNIFGLQKLAVKRMTEMCFGIPVKRVYKPADDNEAKAQNLIEAIFNKNRIDSVNLKRGCYLFASCEVMTLWYAVEEKNNYYGVDSPLKVRCRTFSPMNGESLYPLFDDNGDYIAMSVKYYRKVSGNIITFFETYTKDHYYKWKLDGKTWVEVANNDITIGKNPTLYMYREEPIWEDESPIVYEMEWAISRNGNYLRKNSKPVFTIFADEDIPVGADNPNGGEKSQDTEFRSILQFPEGAKAEYVTWEQAIENLKFYTTELKQSFFTQLQLPDLSYENLKTTPMSGEAMKQMFVDGNLKVTDESGIILEFLDREINVVKAFAKIIDPSLSSAIDSLKVQSKITPFSINSFDDKVTTLTTATGGKAVMSQKEAIQELGHSDDAEATMLQIAKEEAEDGINIAE